MFNKHIFQKTYLNQSFIQLLYLVSLNGKIEFNTYMIIIADIIR
jgi:hypothetical protein